MSGRPFQHNGLFYNTSDIQNLPPDVVEHAVRTFGPDIVPKLAEQGAEAPAPITEDDPEPAAAVQEVEAAQAEAPTVKKPRKSKKSTPTAPEHPEPKE